LYAGRNAIRSSEQVLPILIQVILVPQGSEYRAVCRGLSRISVQSSVQPSVQPIFKPIVKAIPVGIDAVTRYLQQLQQTGFFHPQQQVLVMGLCGSLSDQFLTGEMVLYRECVDGTGSRLRVCDRVLTTQLQSHLKTAVVRGLTSDRVISNAQEKRDLGQSYQADVVDMEGWAVLEVLIQSSIAVTMLRVVSDDCNHNLPDLTSALGAEGDLKAVPLAIAMLRQPIAAVRLIRGALQGLKQLEAATTLLFNSKIL
jgi:Phosphorylase superfamily